MKMCVTNVMIRLVEYSGLEPAFSKSPFQCSIYLAILPIQNAGFNLAKYRQWIYGISGNFGAMEFWLYWRMTKIRQIKKRQFFQPQNLKYV